ncbi:hypothetical protein [Streptomyces sp. NRRL S-237]|uniref:hypothetical protein n=1 Tax=Streptomyces sp. NRRL S-237 TaxID=1463895 RepID=UPI000689220E|nr:hypothetical protein [Streptomyces sp. NRRL S-237]
MSLTSGLHCPRTPLRRFLDRELSAGPRPLQESYRRLQPAGPVLQPPSGVGTEAGTVGTAIDHRLRLAFTTAAPVDPAALAGIELTDRLRSTADRRMYTVGQELTDRLTTTVRDLDLDNRQLPLDRAHDDEEDLARLLLASAWYQVNYRTGIGFALTPLAIAARKDPGGFTLQRLLELPTRDMVADVVQQLYRASTGPLSALRARSRADVCTPGPTFPRSRISADADLIVDGLLLDFKSTRHTSTLRQAEAWQLLGYLLLDTDDRYRIDTLGLYLTRGGGLAAWPVEEYLDLLGACRRDLGAFRAALHELLAGCDADIEPYDQEETVRVRRLLQRLAPAVPQGHCPVCTQPLPRPVHTRRDYCSRWCAVRAPTLRTKGLLPTAAAHTPSGTTDPAPTPRTRCSPPPRRQHPEPPDDATFLSVTPRFPGTSLWKRQQP